MKTMILNKNKFNFKNPLIMGICNVTKDSFSDGGKGLIIGLCVAFIGLTADRLLVEWSKQMKLKLGFKN